MPKINLYTDVNVIYTDEEKKTLQDAINILQKVSIEVESYKNAQVSYVACSFGTAAKTLEYLLNWGENE